MRRRVVARILVPAMVGACAALTVTAPADAAVPDVKGWVAYNQPAAAVLPGSTWPPATTVVVLGVGRYQVKFPGQGASGGVVHVTAVNGAPHWCQAETWFVAAPDELVNIRCYRPGGVLDHSSFSAFFTRSTGPGAAGPYGYVDSMPTGVLVSQYNSAGAGNTSTHLAVGQWRVRFPGLGTAGPVDGGLQATAVNTGIGARCKIATWVSGPGGQDAIVLCFNAGGGAFDTRFTVSYQFRTSLYGAAIPPKYFGYLWNQPPLGPPSTNLNSTGAVNTIVPAGLGLSLVTFPRIGFTPDTVQVTAFGGNPNFCGLNTFWAHFGPGPDTVVRDVNCFTNAGAAVNTGFLISANSLL